MGYWTRQTFWGTLNNQNTEDYWRVFIDDHQMHCPILANFLFLDRVVLVDYDVCSYNYQLLDLAQYTVSAALGYPRKHPEGRVHALLPPDHQRDICRSYLETLRHLESWDRDVIDEDVEKLCTQLYKMSFVSLIYV
jgi:hypothetical protein